MRDPKRDRPALILLWQTDLSGSRTRANQVTEVRSRLARRESVNSS